MGRSFAALALLVSILQAAWAEPRAVIDAVQAPAWVERGASRVPAAAGMPVGEGERIRTGGDARVYVKLADGSTVKVGGNGLLRIEGLAAPQPGRPVFTALLDVLQGAFRFTTAGLTRRAQRDVRIRVSTVTVGIRGTDVWGRTEPEKDFVCLLEGRVTVAHDSGDTREMNEPMTFYLAPRGEPPAGIAPVDPQQVRKWAAETEIEPGAGAARRGGAWKVLLARASGAQEALDTYDRAREAGYAASIRPLTEAGVTTYEVLLRGFAGRTEALAAAGKARAALGLEAVPVR